MRRPRGWLAASVISFLTFSTLRSSPAATAKPSAQKVVFIGDAATYSWGLPANSSAFQGNPRWLNKGLTGRQNSAAILARFQSDVVSEHPAVVHILAGAVDINEADDATTPTLVQNFQSNLVAMVAEAAHANIKVILGTIPPQLIANQVEQPQVWQVFEPTLIQNLNSWIETFGAENNIPVINYHDILCSCVGSSNPAPVAQYPFMSGDGSNPSPAGFAAMTPLVSLAIATLPLAMERGYVSPAGNVSVRQGNSLALTAYAVYSDGIPRPLLNTNYAGVVGTWSSSNPTVLYAGYNGEVSAFSPGEATITFTALNGMSFEPAVVTVTPAR